MPGKLEQEQVVLVTHVTPVNIVQALWSPVVAPDAPLVSFKKRLDKLHVSHAFQVRIKTYLDSHCVKNVLKIPKANTQILPPVILVVLVQNQNPVVPHVTNVMRVKQVLALMVLAMCVKQVDTVQVVCRLLRVLNVPLVLAKAIRDKRRVQNAAPVNSMSLLVLSYAHHV
jgi:hypothetical protein